jgi:glycosyltransferase involved in cell wall biosynthesis
LPTENNGAKRKYLRSIRSIIMQDYLNYHFIVIDNASTDKTGTLMEEELLKQKKVPSSNYKIIKNNERKTEL